MSTENRQGGSTTSGQSTSQSQEIRAHLDEVTKNPEQFRSYFGEVVERANKAGITQQQLLDTVSDKYRSTNKS
jgi:hypothetical protein